MEQIFTILSLSGFGLFYDVDPLITVSLLGEGRKPKGNAALKYVLKMLILF